jgi:hypothetical protein
MNRAIETAVLIVGAGPVGLTLAMDLAWRGVNVTVADLRGAGEPPSVKCNQISARSMEIFRRLGVAGKLRAVGLPADYPNDVVSRTTMTGIELSRVTIPSRAERYIGAEGPDTRWPTPEPPHRVNQIYFEPVLYAHAACQSRIRMLYRTAVESFIQDERGVSAVACDLDSGERLSIACTYLVGCDGGKLLDAYEAERQPITEQVSRFAMDMALKIMQHRRRIPAEIEWPGPVGEATRARIGKEAYDLDVQLQCCGGLNFGYFYDNSPIAAYDGEPQPAYSMGNFTPSTVPGCRAPHLWLGDHHSLYDALGPDYTLIRFDRTVNVSGVVEAAAQRGVPLAVLEVDAPDARELYARNLVLVRPDQHVAWRGDEAPAAPLDLIDLVRGARVMSARKKTRAPRQIPEHPGPLFERPKRTAERAMSSPT